MAASKYKDSDPLTDKEVYGKVVERSYREAVTPEQYKLLKALGQEPSDEQTAQEAADAPVADATGGDTSGPKA